MPPPPIPPAVAAPDYLEAYRLSIATDFVVGSLSVFIWDILYNLGSDYRLIRTHGVNIPSAVYLLSRLHIILLVSWPGMASTYTKFIYYRISTLGFTLMGAILLTMPLNNCHTFAQGVLGLYGILICTTMLLSYFRVCAVWNKNRYIAASFFALWIISVAGSLTIIKGMPFFHILGSPYCVELVIEDIVVTAIYMPTINHILVFIATAYGVCKTHLTHERCSTMRIGYSLKLIVLGETLPEFSKAILQASQLCYLVAALSGMTAIVWFYEYATDPGYRLAIFVPYSVIVNIMFSWVFRTEKLWAPTNPFSAKATGRNTMVATPRIENIELNSSGASLGSSSRDPMQIEVSKVVEYKSDGPGSNSEQSVGTVEFLDFRVEQM